MDIFNVQALQLILIFEGSTFTNNPADKGGPTRYGITQAAYDSYLVKKNKVKCSVQSIAMSEVKDIYYSNYWLPAKCDSMSGNLPICVFDTAVNMGQGRSIKFLQQIIGATVDGVIGQETIKKLANFDQNVLAGKFLDAREAFYNQIVKNDSSQSVFLKGWIRRVEFVRAFITGTKTLDQIKASW